MTRWIIWSACCFLLFVSRAQAADILDPGVGPCVNAYYGIGQRVNYDKAYKCFQSKNVYEFMAIMQLNGEGTPKNAQKAEQTMKLWFKSDPDNADNVDADQMRQAVAAHLADPHAPRTDFCDDVGYTTYSMDFCSDVQNRLQEQKTRKAMHAIRASLNPAQQVLWDSIQNAEKIYARAEGLRIYKRYESGTIRAIAADAQVSSVRDDFQGLMTTVFANRSLKPASSLTVGRLNSELRKKYKSDIDEFIQDEAYLIEPDSSAEERRQYASTVADYKIDAKNSQTAWETLRKKCAALAKGIYKQKGVDWSVSVSAAMLKLRIEEIENDPVGPGESRLKGSEPLKSVL